MSEYHTKIRARDTEGNNVHIDIDSQGDHYITIWSREGTASARFCSAQGGGSNSYETKRAIRNLALAMKQEGAENEGVKIEERIDNAENSRRILENFKQERDGL